MNQDKMVDVSSFAKDEYGINAAPIEAMINYGYVLLTIAGADGEVSKEEMEWLVNHQKKFGASEEIIALYKSFDYKNAILEDLLPHITCDVPTFSAEPNLIYHAIQMSSADGIYAEKERAKVKKAAKLLGLRDDIVLTIESLIEMERAVSNMRKALFHISTL